MTILRRLRGLVGTALTWGAIGAAVGVGAFVVIFHPWPLSEVRWERTLTMFAVWEGVSFLWGVACGLARLASSSWRLNALVAWANSAPLASPSGAQLREHFSRHSSASDRSSAVRVRSTSDSLLERVHSPVRCGRARRSPWRDVFLTCRSQCCCGKTRSYRWKVSRQLHMTAWFSAKV
jgi:hypothetical protein